MDFELVRQKMNSDEGKELLADLNSLRLDVEDFEQTLNCLKCKYFIQSLEYKKFLGYSLSDEEIKNLEKAKEDLEDFSHEKV